VAIVKRGPAGVLARTAAGVVEVDAVPCEVVNGLGAGDAFGGALVHALIEGWSLEHAIRFANAAGSFVAARFACADAMPTIEDLADHVPAVPA
jgi:5-dehydro-2-deoxygluconokinase